MYMLCYKVWCDMPCCVCDDDVKWSMVYGSKNVNATGDTRHDK